MSANAKAIQNDAAKQDRSRAFWRDALIVVAGSLLLTLSAKVEIPFYPVPMTMQTAVVVGLGLALGWQRALAAILLYLAQGAAGFPVFAGTPEKGIGLAYMAGPTGGYLLGFVLAGIATGVLGLAHWARRPLPAILVASLGMALIYVPGVLWLGVLFGFDKPILEWGLYPFVMGDILKAALAGLVVYGIARRRRS